MLAHLCLSPKSLYPILSHDFHLISDTKLFSSLIATHDFSRVMSKLQLLKLKKTPLTMMFSIKTNSLYKKILSYSHNFHLLSLIYCLNTLSPDISHQTYIL